MGFLYFIIILLSLYLLFRIFFRYLFPFLLARYIKKKQEKIFGNVGKNNERIKDEGEVSIDYAPGKSKRIELDDIGEYTDFEDVEDDPSNN